jgi:aminoglycoside 6'-N-acetyltransferase I
MPEFITRPVTPEDTDAWCQLRAKLWASHQHHSYDISHYFDQPEPEQMALLAFSSTVTDIPIGFIEVSLHNDPPSTGNPPIASVEGWYVADFMRHAGAGKTLLQAAEAWATKQGCSQITSECDLNNLTSASAHRSCGFVESRRSISFSKKLPVT